MSQSNYSIKFGRIQARNDVDPLSDESDQLRSTLEANVLISVPPTLCRNMFTAYIIETQMKEKKWIMQIFLIIDFMVWSRLLYFMFSLFA